MILSGKGTSGGLTGGNHESLETSIGGALEYFSEKYWLAVALLNLGPGIPLSMVPLQADLANLKKSFL